MKWMGWAIFAAMAILSIGVWHNGQSKIAMEQKKAHAHFRSQKDGLAIIFDQAGMDDKVLEEKRATLEDQIKEFENRKKILLDQKDKLSHKINDVSDFLDLYKMIQEEDDRTRIAAPEEEDLPSRIAKLTRETKTLTAAIKKLK